MIDPLADLAYLLIAGGITFLVGRSLQARGIASLVTFYLFAFGAIALMYRWGEPNDYRQAVDYLSTKLAFILFVLGSLNAVKRIEYAQRHRKEVQS